LKEEKNTSTRKEEEKRLLKRSIDFLETASYQKSQGFYDLAAFSLEQALQLCLKARLLAEGVEYPRTHSLRKLLKILSQVAPESKKAAAKSAMENYVLEIGMLEDAYITSRYVMREFTKKEVEKLTVAVREIMKNVL
jgi:HEPN domain-containing protein